MILSQPPSQHSAISRKPKRRNKKRLTFGLTCTVLCKIPLTPISVELLLNTPPTHEAAKNTTNVSTLFAPTTTTRSPLRTPLAAIAAAALPALRRSSPHETCVTTEPPSRTSVTAILASSLPAVDDEEDEDEEDGEREKSKFSAKLRDAPSNQRGTASMGWDSSTARAGVPEWMRLAASKTSDQNCERWARE